MEPTRRIVGRGIPMPADDIDTDRIIPARYLKAVTFEGLGEHVFEDDRRQDPEHPFNQAGYQGASLLVVGLNFGCGSSREHAGEALKRWGIRAIVGGSFGEIFFGNCTALGIPCVTAAMTDIAWLSRAVALTPSEPLTLDVERGEIHFGGRILPAMIPTGARHQFLNGSWSAIGVLLEAGPAIEQAASRLPYVAGYQA
ncbi:MAG: 3-isopropylmalate dehydratase small subunit [Candidatus Rokuibacteriota bacterium]